MPSTFRKRIPGQDEEYIKYLEGRLHHVSDQYLKKDRVREVLDEVIMQIIQPLLKSRRYIDSFTGNLIFRQWYRNNGLSVVHAELLVVLGYFEICRARDLTLFSLYRMDHIKALNELIEWGYVIRTTTQRVNKIGRQRGYALTQKGKDFEKDYEKFYDRRLKEIETKKPTLLSFDTQDYFRRVKVPKNVRRAKIGGGAFPKGRSLKGMYVQPEEVDWDVLPNNAGSVPGMFFDGVRPIYPVIIKKSDEQAEGNGD